MQTRSLRVLTLVLCGTVASVLYAQDPGSILPTAGNVPSVQNTFYGPSGLIHVPSAYTVAQGDIRFGTQFERDQRTLTGNYGIYRDIEVGGAWLERTGRDGKAIGNAKVRIQAANFRNVDIGIGVIDAFDAVDQTVYVVGSVNLVEPRAEDNVLGTSVGLRAHVGYGSGVFNDHIIGGGELLFSRDFSIVGEYDGDQANFGLRFARTNFSAQAGVANHRLFFGFTAGVKL